MLHFQHIVYFWGLLLLPLVGYLFWQLLAWKKRTAKKIGDPMLVQQLTNNYSHHHFIIKFILTLGAIAFVVFSLVNLQWKTGSSKITRKGVDLMVLLDVSNSMLAEDLQPNRLERAKQVVARMLDDLPDDRIGLILFAGHAYLQMPVTSDHAAAKMYLAAASPLSVSTQGTVIGEALQMAAQVFNNKDKKNKAVILITDGEDHDETALKAAEQLHNQGVVVHAIGLGSPTGAFIIDPATGARRKDAEGNEIISKLNEPLLKDIVQQTGGSYQLYSNTDVTVTGLENALSAMGQQSYEDDRFVQYDSYFYVFLIVALLLLIVEQYISERKPQVV